MTDKAVWRCICGCWSFFIADDGTVECTACHTVTDNHAEAVGEWVRQILPEAEEVKEITEPMTTQVVMGEEEFAKRRVLKYVEQCTKSDTLAALFVMSRDLATRTWFNFDIVPKTELINRIQGILEHIRNVKDES